MIVGFSLVGVGLVLARQGWDVVFVLVDRAGCAVPSVLGLLEAKETAAREEIERLQAEAERVLAELGEAEGRLERLVIAREMVAEVVKAPAVPEQETAVTCVDTVLTGITTVPRRREGLSPRVLPAQYQQLLAALDSGAAGGGMRARALAAALGRQPVPTKIECVRSMAKRLVARGWAVEEQPGLFTPAALSAQNPAGG